MPTDSRSPCPPARYDSTVVYVRGPVAPVNAALRSVQGDSAVLLLDGETVATQGRFVRLSDRSTRATYRRPVRMPTGLADGLVVEELTGGAIRPLGTDRVLRTAPDHSPQDFVRSALRFSGVDGRERRLVADSLVFSSELRYQRGRVWMPRPDRQPENGVYFARERIRCTVAPPGSAEPDRCERVEQDLWHIRVDGTGLRRVASLPLGDALVDMGAARGGGTIGIAVRRPGLSGQTVGAVLVVDGASGQVATIPGIDAERVGIMPDGRTVVATGGGFGVVADASVGVLRKFGVPSLRGTRSAYIVGVAPDSGLVLGLNTEQVMLTALTGPRAGMTRPLRRRSGDPHWSAITHLDALPDASRVLFVGDHYAAYYCDPG